MYDRRYEGGVESVALLTEKKQTPKMGAILGANTTTPEQGGSKRHKSRTIARRSYCPPTELSNRRRLVHELCPGHYFDNFSGGQ